MHTNDKSKLALYGGVKVRQKKMPPRKAFDDSDLKAIKAAFKYYAGKGLDFGYQGRYEQLYTDAFVKYLGAAGYCDAVNSGTSALYVALAALRLEPGSQVLVSPVTDPGTINAIILNQLRPVLADSSLDSFSIGAEEYEARLSDKIKAAVIVHIGGKAAPIDKIRGLSKSRGIYLIEDCSQAHGAKISGKKVGTFGDIAAFSTMYRKTHATGGCGGVVYTQDKNLYDMVRSFADRGKPFHRCDFNEKDPSSFLFPAHNMNIDELSCVVGLGSLKKLDGTIRRRVEFLSGLRQALHAVSGVCRIAEVSSGDSPFFCPISVEVKKISCSKSEFARAVQAEGIDINPDYRYVVCEWPWVKRYLADDISCRNAIAFRESSFNLLLNENYGQQEIKDIIQVIKKVESVFIK